MLDILENFCKLKQYDFLRLDGSTNTTSRQGIVDIFNCSYTKFSNFCCFLYIFIVPNIIIEGHCNTVINSVLVMQVVYVN